MTTIIPSLSAIYSANQTPPIAGAWNRVWGSNWGGPPTLWVGPQREVVNFNQNPSFPYNDTNTITRLNDGRLLCVFRQGINHAEGNSALLGKISGNPDGWSQAPFLIQDGVGDDRNHSVLYNPTTDRICVIYRRFTSGGTTLAREYIYTDDRFQTIQGPFDLGSIITRDIIPFGKSLFTSQGYIHAWYAADDIQIYRSPSGSFTDWTAGAVIVGGGGIPGENLTEPAGVALDADRVYYVMRSNPSTSKGQVYGSTDGGASWSYLGEAELGGDHSFGAGFSVSLTPGGDVLFTDSPRGDRQVRFRVINRAAWISDPVFALTNATPTVVYTQNPILGTDDDFGYPDIALNGNSTLLTYHSPVGGDDATTVFIHRIEGLF